MYVALQWAHMVQRYISHNISQTGNYNSRFFFCIILRFEKVATWILPFSVGQISRFRQNCELLVSQKLTNCFDEGGNLETETSILFAFLSSKSFLRGANWRYKKHCSFIGWLCFSSLQQYFARSIIWIYLEKLRFDRTIFRIFFRKIFGPSEQFLSPPPPNCC